MTRAASSLCLKISLSSGSSQKPSAAFHFSWRIVSQKRIWFVPYNCFIWSTAALWCSHSLIFPLLLFPWPAASAWSFLDWPSQRTLSLMWPTWARSPVARTFSAVVCVPSPTRSNGCFCWPTRSRVSLSWSLASMSLFPDRRSSPARPWGSSSRECCFWALLSASSIVCLSVVLERCRRRHLSPLSSERSCSCLPCSYLDLLTLRVLYFSRRAPASRVSLLSSA